MKCVKFLLFAFNLLFVVSVKYYALKAGRMWSIQTNYYFFKNALVVSVSLYKLKHAFILIIRIIILSYYPDL